MKELLKRFIGTGERICVYMKSRNNHTGMVIEIDNGILIMKEDSHIPIAHIDIAEIESVSTK